jgi:hypothetical protein
MKTQTCVEPRSNDVWDCLGYYVAADSAERAYWQERSVDTHDACKTIKLETKGKMTWSACSSECAKESKTLPCPVNKAHEEAIMTYAMIYRVASYDDMAWLAFQDNHTEGDWTSHLEGCNMSGYRNWAPGEPNNHKWPDASLGENCAGVYAGVNGWVDTPCSREMTCMCESFVTGDLNDAFAGMCDDSKCSSYGNDCCAPGEEPATCRDGYTSVITGNTESMQWCPDNGGYKCCQGSRRLSVNRSVPSRTPTVRFPDLRMIAQKIHNVTTKRQLSASCAEGMTYSEADAYCKNKGERLCTTKSIRQGWGKIECPAAAAGFVWTQDACEPSLAQPPFKFEEENDW